MRLLNGLGVASTVWMSVATSPVNLQPRAGDFIVHQTVPKPFKKTGPAAILSTYDKYNASAPKAVIRALTANDGFVLANPTLYDAEYLSPVTIGGQTLNLNFDTGSSDLALEGYTWAIVYGDRSTASGVVSTDTVKIGSTTVTGQAVELANQLSTKFVNDRESDGLVGLGFDIGNTGEPFASVYVNTGLPWIVQPVQQKTFFSNAQASLSAPLFTANLQKDKPGCYTFGYVDAREHTGFITYVPANSNRGYWNFRSNGYAVGTEAFRSFSFAAVVDTGSSLNYLPDRIVRAYYRSVNGSGYNYDEGGYTYPCSAILPSFTVGIGTYQAVIPGSYITYARVNNSTCFGGIQSSIGLPVNILGDIFLKTQFVVFQASPLQLGFAPKPLSVS
ncbi:MAG: hypothetical protein Q9169_001750 [Polycauliona sp. 2 TL-2023]